MRKCFLIVAISVYMLSCTTVERDNEFDMNAVNYKGSASGGGSSSGMEADISSSGGEAFSSSSVETGDEPSSSGEASSSSVEPSSSSSGPGSSSEASSSSVEPGSSSVEQSSSSSEPGSSSEASSSGVEPSSSSAVPLCGGAQYDPELKFCYNNYTVDKCGGKEFNPTEEVCNTGVVGKMCGSAWYNHQTHFCLGGVATPLCGGNEYTAAQFCRGGAVYNKCDGKEYELTHFCYGTTVYEKCGGGSGDAYIPVTEQCCGSIKYNVAAQFCSSNARYDKCGGTVAYAPGTEECCGSDKYAIATHFCLNSNAITPLCGGKTYTNSQFCHTDNDVYDKCGGSDYNPDTHFCLSSVITPLCGGQTFTNSQFCYESTVRSKCGGTVEFTPGTEECCGSRKYTIDTHFCYNNSKVGKYCGTRKDSSDIYNPDLYKCKPNINLNGIYLKTPVNYEGKSYEAVLIGEQTWMAENLNYNAEGSKCYGEDGQVSAGYDEENQTPIYRTLSNAEVQANCARYGRLYDWSTAMNNAPPSITVPSNVQGVCPSGWHLPSYAEWRELATFAGGCRMLKATSGWSYDGNGTDDYGFSALPGGNGNSGGDFYEVGYVDNWWSASEYEDVSYGRYMHCSTIATSLGYSSKSNLFSVRCVQD